MRSQITDAGWVVRDVAGGYTLERVSLTTPPDRSAAPDTHDASVAILAEGWPDDVTRCVESVVAHTGMPILLLHIGVQEGVEYDPERVTAWQLPTETTWAAARTALLRADTARIHVWLDPSIELTGDAVAPLVAALDGSGIGAAGPYGVTLAEDWLSFDDATTPGDVDAANGYLLAFRRAALLAAGGPHPKARFYRNADLELAFTLRANGWRTVMTGDVPVIRHRHRGYQDTDPAHRDRESKRNYDRFLATFRGRDDLRA